MCFVTYNARSGDVWWNGGMAHSLLTWRISGMQWLAIFPAYLALGKEFAVTVR